MQAVLNKLPTAATVNAIPRARAKGAEPSRLQVKESKAQDEGKLERAWKREVFKRDGGCCRWCKRKVRKCLDLVPERAECHHLAGRVVVAIRWLRANGLLLCRSCHERVTGKVAEKFVIIASKTYTVDGVAYPNGDKKVSFKRIV